MRVVPFSAGIRLSGCTLLMVAAVATVSRPAEARPEQLSWMPFAPVAEDTPNRTELSRAAWAEASAGPTGQLDFQQPAVPASPAPASPTTKPELPEEPKPATEARTKKECKFLPCPTPLIDWYKRFENGPQVKPLTPHEKAWLATKNVIDPFNILTILGIDAISVAADSHSAYGPGFAGWGRNVGVSFTEDITGEFFGTFLIPTLVHQDPHYHRMPQASLKKRIAHALYQVAWTQGDNGKGMLNYATLAGFGIDDEIANLYVPGRQTNASATSQRYVIALATAPIDNFITEFLPDVAKKIHIQVVVVQRIIDQIASKDAAQNQ